MIDFSTPLAGMDRATSSLNQTAGKIARSSFSKDDSQDLSTDMVNLMQSKNNFEANTKVVQTEDDMTKSLLNMLA